jgi:hypothetical protein
MVQDSLSDATIIEKRGPTGVATIATAITGKREANLNCNALKTDLWAESISLGESASDDERSDRTNSDSGVPKGCQFSPDGTCLLTARANKLELYNTPFEKEEEHKDDKDDGSGGSSSGGGWEPALICNSGESVRSYAWYPHMKSSDPASCCFLGVSRGSPVHLYDAYDGSIRASYRPYNALDEMESPTTLCFAENGQKLVTGGLRSDRILHVFDVNRPGREHTPPLLRLGKTRRSKDGQKGLVSAMAYSERKGVIAVGTYSPGSIYLYDLRTYSRSAVAEIVMSSSASTSSGGAVCLAGHGKKGKKNKRKRFATPSEDDDTANDRTSDGNHSPTQPSSMNFSAAKLQWYQSRTRGGVTQVEFEDEDENGAGGHYLFSTSRRSNAILQWDLRKLSSSNFCPGIANFETNNDTNQRIEFRVKGDQLWTGGIDGCVRVYSHRKQQIGTESSLLAKLTGFRDCVNGISLHPEADLNPEKLFGANPNSNSNSSDDKNGDANGADCTSNSGPTKSLLAVAIGRRHFPSENDWEEDNPHASLTNRTKRFVGSTQIYSLERL